MFEDEESPFLQDDVVKVVFLAIPMMMMINACVDVDDDASLRPPAKNTNNNNNNNNEAYQQLAIMSSSSLPKKRTSINDENDGVFDATAIVFSVVGFNLCFLLGLAVWVKGLKTRYENAIWKIKRLESEKRDLAVAHNMEKADLADPLRAGSPTSSGEYGSGYGRRGGAAIGGLDLGLRRRGRRHDPRFKSRARRLEAGAENHANADATIRQRKRCVRKPAGNGVVGGGKADAFVTPTERINADRIHFSRA